MKTKYSICIISLLLLISSCTPKPEKGIIRHTSNLIEKINKNIESFSGTDYSSLIKNSENMLYADSSYYTHLKIRKDVTYMMSKVLCTNMYKNMIYAMEESKKSLTNPECSDSSKKEFLKELSTNFDQYLTGLNAYLNKVINGSQKEKLEILTGLLVYTSGEQIEASMLSINLNFASKNREVLKRQNDNLLLNDKRKKITQKIMNKQKE